MRKLYYRLCNPVNAVRTVAETKAAFQKGYQRPINSVYRRFVEEFLTELHLVTVNNRFAYNPFFALGVVEVFRQFMQGYTPETEPDKILAAACQALQLKPTVIQQDARKLVELLESSDPDRALGVLRLQNTADDIGGLTGILAKIRDDSAFHYSRTFLLGLFIAFEKVAGSLGDADRRKDVFVELTQTLNLSKERVEKDLDLYRSNIDKLAQAQAVVRDLAEASRRQKSRDDDSQPVAEPAPATSEDVAAKPPAPAE